MIDCLRIIQHLLQRNLFCLIKLLYIISYLNAKMDFIYIKVLGLYNDFNILINNVRYPILLEIHISLQIYLYEIKYKVSIIVCIDSELKF